jgi:hypothetical protein
MDFLMSQDITPLAKRVVLGACLLLCLDLAMASPSIAGAAAPDSLRAQLPKPPHRPARHRLIIENDGFGFNRSDRYYTSGGRYSVDFPARREPRLLYWLDRFLLAWVDLDIPMKSDPWIASDRNQGWALVTFPHRTGPFRG